MKVGFTLSAWLSQPPTPPTASEPAASRSRSSPSEQREEKPHPTGAGFCMVMVPPSQLPPAWQADEARQRLLFARAQITLEPGAALEAQANTTSGAALRLLL